METKETKDKRSVLCNFCDNTAEIKHGVTQHVEIDVCLRCYANLNT